MITNIFQQALVAVKARTVVCVHKLSLPAPMHPKGYSTPYLRRRMYGRLRGLCD